MLKNITLQNFFSFGKATTIPLNAGVNILVGINGSGKSNLLKAIRLLREGIGERKLEKLIQDSWGGFESVANFGQQKSEELSVVVEYSEAFIISLLKDGRREEGITNPFTYWIDLKKEKQSFKISKEKFRWYDGSTLFVDIADNKGMLLFKTDITKKFPEDFENANSLSEKESLVWQSDAFTETKLQYCFTEPIVYQYFNTAENATIRGAVAFMSDKVLQPSGDNLVHILQHIKHNHALEFDKIEGFLSAINPNFKSVEFIQFGSKSVLALKEKHLARTVLAEHISDGTLRFLLLLAILYNPDRGKMICLDEPENGLHPDMINIIAEGVKYAAGQGTQVLVATHSPLMLNYFEVSDLVVFEKDSDNETLVKTFTSDDFEEEELALLPGNLWLNGKIGGVRW
jgi:predicted ATPase